MNFAYSLDNSDEDRDQRISQAQVPWTHALEATAQDAWVHNPVHAIVDTTEYYEAQHPEWRGPLGELEAMGRPVSADEPVDADTLNQQYGESLGLSFDQPQRRGAVDILVNQKKQQLQRDYTLAHAPSGVGYTAASLATSLAVSAADPLNVAAAFVPVVGEARAGLWAERVGPTAARLGQGAIEGGVGTAALQPVEAVRDDAFQQEYGPADAFWNVAFGTVLGGGLHAGIGKISDMLDRLHSDTREAALRTAVAQSADGRPADVEAALKSDPAYATVTEPGPVTSLPVIDEEGIRLSSREAQIESDISSLKEHLSGLPEGDQNASDTLARLQAVEQQLASPDLDPAMHKTLSTRRDELLTNTTPEQLQEAASPIDERRNAQNQLDASQRELDTVRAQQVDRLAQRLSPEALERLRSYGYKPEPLDLAGQQEASRGVQAPDAGSIAQPEGLGGGEGTVPAATSTGAVPQDFSDALSRARDASLSPGPTPATSPQASLAADALLKSRAGDDVDVEHQQALAQVAEYEKQGILSAEQAEQARAGSEDIQKAQRDGEAAKAAARCLLLHP